MSVNREKWHLLIKPEDDANRQAALGFLQSLELTAQNKVQIDRPAGGYLKALEFVHAAQLEHYKNRRVLILIDFDQSVEVRRRLTGQYAAVSDRVFILGANHEVEDLRRELSCHLEQCGELIAADCKTGKCEIWNKETLRHNRDVLERFCREVGKELFSALTPHNA